MITGSQGTETSVPLTDDLERYIEETSDADPGFKVALEDAEELQRLLDTLITLRRERHLSQTDVAERMGVRQPTVSGFEKQSDPRMSTLQRYARAVEARLRFVVENPSTCGWVSPGTQAYLRGQTTQVGSSTHKNCKILATWRHTSDESSGTWASSRLDWVGVA
ncbi:helix-turn-helix domain-containing protein [Mycobacterium sp. MOTT36Y]|uniref:helix-turn-helix domain-containing protein n=1 Tax=Mycobacterium sp. MOTT36Y TaxID=1168287 RepID=UPI00025D5CA1|nr:helix-turn-helix domain-containing protein [Mycobacterium sp. MOTT36Y]AFJ34724.1 putative transciptional regulatory protein [Mycobacterium sp. MOTT36Y]